MDLRNNQIKMSEILANPKAKEILKREFPRLMNPMILRRARNMTLADVLRFARGRVSQDKIDKIITELAGV